MKRPPTGTPGQEAEVFSFKLPEPGRVVLQWRGRDVTVLEGLRAQRFLDRVRAAGPEEMQRLIAAATGRF